ncbi:hypothetical protein GCM10009760_03820 [Kitasatospora kazusensis]|uniref:Uncharacterized protein n=1 Tax=Kitasatospora kazusensis TaxID=407974 RepID=A0ABN2YQW4_9ACTN
MTLARIALPSGRSIELSSVQLSSTYGGMLEGYPHGRWNDRLLERLLRNTEQARPGTPVHLVTPVREYPDTSAGGFGPVELLPAVTCVGSFESHPVDPQLVQVLHRSTLTVIWFQATPDMPSDDAPDDGLRGIRWDELAKDYEL